MDTKNKTISRPPYETLRLLEQLLEMHMLDKEEFEARKHQLILTTTIHSSPSPFPLFEPRLAGTERAIRHTLDPKKKIWRHTAAIVLVDPQPFAERGTRIFFRMRDLSREGVLSLMVAKTFRGKHDDWASYFKQAEMQFEACEVGRKFNRRNPPKKVDILVAYVYELVDRPRKQICCAEYFIPETVHKHNSSFGYICDSVKVNTQAAFSHFSYEDSNGQMVVADMQAVATINRSTNPHLQWERLWPW